MQVALLLEKAVSQVALILTLCYDLPMLIRGGGVVAMTEVALFRGRAMPQVALHLGSANSRAKSSFNSWKC